MSYKRGDRVLVRWLESNGVEFWEPGTLGLYQGGPGCIWEIRMDDGHQAFRYETAIKPDNSELIKKWMGL